MVVKTEKLPQLGETKLGGTFFMNAGGKGANQAVAVARIGGNVTFVTKVGNDIFGKQTIEDLKTECINTSNVFIDEFAPSGVALIMVNVAPGYQYQRAVYHDNQSRKPAGNASICIKNNQNKNCFKLLINRVYEIK